MIDMLLSNAAAALQTDYFGKDVRFHGCSTDSRNVKTGEMFIALRGERFNGHDYIENAKQGGAVAAIVDSESEPPLPFIPVNNCRDAMGTLAGMWRSKFNIPVIAITGSNGKTTVKQMVSEILSLQAPVLATSGNQNNDIGVPLTLFKIGLEHNFAVIEMGANHPGEISYLSNMAGPDVAVITQCAPAHLEGFGSIDKVAEAKAEIFDGLSENGIAVINNDDEYADYWKDRTSGVHQITFGLTSDADVVANNIKLDADAGRSIFEMILGQDRIQVQLNLPGLHNVQNSLAAAACCLAVNVPVEIIRKGLENTCPVKGRLQIKKGLHGACVVDDTYNANPVSLEAAMKLVAQRDGCHWLALGDMGELGAGASDYHFLSGEKAREYGFEKLFALGRLSEKAVEGFGNGARHFADIDALIRQLKMELVNNVTLLVKGSRAMAMDRVVDALTEEG